MPKLDLKRNLTAGVTTAIMLVPQAMAYAMLAGLPPVVGLYASMLPLIVYAMLGSSRELAVGPVAIDSLMTGAILLPIVSASTTSLVEMAALLAILVGLVQLLLGILRGGFLVNFLSDPVVAGFSSAAALVIGVSQLPHVLGIEAPRSQDIFLVLGVLWEKRTTIEIGAFGVGIGAIAFLLLQRKYLPRVPGALVVVVAGTLISYVADLAASGTAIVGQIPASLPGLLWPTWDLDLVYLLLPGALSVAMVGYMESISVARTIAQRKGYEIAPNRELVAVGAANIAGGFTGGYPIAGGFSRTAVNAQAGADSRLAGALTGIAVALSVLFLTPLLYHLPKAVLAAIVLAAVSKLVDIAGFVRLSHVKTADMVMMAVTFVATLALGVQWGIPVGIAVSVFWFMVRTTRPHYAVLGRIGATNYYRNVLNHPDAKTTPGILALRIDAQFYFGNVTFLRHVLQAEEERSPGPLRAIILDASAINQLDSSADKALHQLALNYRERGIRFVVTGAKMPVIRVLQASGTFDSIGENNFYLGVHEAYTSLAGSEGIANPLEDQEGVQIC